MRVWVFSDLHLTDVQTPLFQSFLKALEEPSSEDDHVVFAGDIFDLLLGNSSFFAEKYADFLNAVRILDQKKVNLYYIEGNHDFHLKPLFNETHIHFEDEQIVLAVTIPTQEKTIQKKILIAHGDLIDQEDVGYLRLRKFFRSSFIGLLSKLVPGRLIQKIGDGLSRPLEQKERDLPQNWSQEKRDLLRKKFRGFAQDKKRQGYDYIILGHCHDLDEIPPFYFNMGYPPVHRQFLFYDSHEDNLKRRNFTGIQAK